MSRPETVDAAALAAVVASVEDPPAVGRTWFPATVKLPGATVEAWILGDCAACGESVYEHTPDDLRACAAVCADEMGEAAAPDLCPCGLTREDLAQGPGVCLSGRPAAEHASAAKGGDS